MAKGYLYDNGDELISREDVNEVPDSSSAHAGDVLSLDSNKKPKWSTPESELPDATSASEGDVLSLNASKEPVWSTPSGGGIKVVHIDESSMESVTIDNIPCYLFQTDATVNDLENWGVLSAPEGSVSHFFPLSYIDPEGGVYTTYPYTVSFGAMTLYAQSASSNIVFIQEK